MTPKLLENLDDLYKEKCPQCKQDFESNHLNRSYCSDKCRIRYNNMKARAKRLTNKLTTKILDKNTEILNEYKDGSIVPIQVLENKGYRFDFQTNRIKDKKGVVYAVCFSSGIAFVDNDKTEGVIKHFESEEIVEICRLIHN
jgi:endogenous inhibitor of DNA gyrase (YacG/DUF329 family)